MSHHHATPEYAWDLPNSTLYMLNPDGSYGEMLGWCERYGDRHKEIGWFGFGVDLGMVGATYYPDECTARQAVLDAVRGSK